MMNDLLKIYPDLETNKITSFIKTTLQKQGFENTVIGLSGGVDSAVSLSLLQKSIAPQNIFVAHLYYFKSQINLANLLLEKANIPQKNIYNISIKNAVDTLAKTIGLTKTSKDYYLRLGNIMARVRMITLYDLSKKHKALVCGTENKSEFLLGYFTRFGDEASDIEPIRHLYKTQVYELAKYLNVPQNILNQKPSPGLWAQHTAEKELGFPYKEADAVLTAQDSKKMNFPNAKKIIDRVRKNSFKRHLPYIIDP